MKKRPTITLFNLRAYWCIFSSLIFFKANNLTFSYLTLISYVFFGAVIDFGTYTTLFPLSLVYGVFFNIQILFYILTC